MRRWVCFAFLRVEIRLLHFPRSTAGTLLRVRRLGRARARMCHLGLFFNFDPMVAWRCMAPHKGTYSIVKERTRPTRNRLCGGAGGGPERVDQRVTTVGGDPATRGGV